jgi:hypothetical protein
MAEYICSKCNEKIGFGREKIPLKNKKGEELLVCGTCYNAMSKEEKLELTPLKNIKGIGTLTGFAVGGLIGGWAFSDIQNEDIMKPIKQHNLSLQEINIFSIMNYNRHFLLCDNTLKSVIMGKMGKELNNKKLDELAKQRFSKEYDLIDIKEQKLVDKDLKLFLKENMKKNKKLNLKAILQNDGY